MTPHDGDETEGKEDAENTASRQEAMQMNQRATETAKVIVKGRMLRIRSETAEEGREWSGAGRRLVMLEKRKKSGRKMALKHEDPHAAAPPPLHELRDV